MICIDPETNAADFFDVFEILIQYSAFEICTWFFLNLSNHKVVLFSKEYLKNN